MSSKFTVIESTDEEKLQEMDRINEIGLSIAGCRMKKHGMDA